MLGGGHLLQWWLIVLRIFWSQTRDSTSPSKVYTEGASYLLSDPTALEESWL